MKKIILLVIGLMMVYSVGWAEQLYASDMTPLILLYSNDQIDIYTDNGNIQDEVQRQQDQTKFNQVNELKTSESPSITPKIYFVYKTDSSRQKMISSLKTLAEQDKQKYWKPVYTARDEGPHYLIKRDLADNIKYVVMYLYCYDNQMCITKTAYLLPLGQIEKIIKTSALDYDTPTIESTFNADYNNYIVALYFPNPDNPLYEPIDNSPIMKVVIQKYIDLVKQKI